MFILKDDHEDVDYKISPPKFYDAENRPIEDVHTTTTVESSNPDAVSVLPTSGDPLSGKLHIGSPGDAAVIATTRDGSGQVVKISGAQFHITTGDPANIQGGDMSFEGLEEATTAQPPAAPVVEESGASAQSDSSTAPTIDGQSGSAPDSADTSSERETDDASAVE